MDDNVEYRDRQRQMYEDYQAPWDSQGRDSHRAFLRMINDPVANPHATPAPRADHPQRRPRGGCGLSCRSLAMTS